MAYEFETESVPHLVADAERLLQNAGECERRLVSLLSTLNGNVAQALESIRELRAAAGIQRQLAEAVLARLVGPAGDHTGQRALIVDDNHDNCEVAATALEASGFEVITAANGLDGVIAAHCAHPSIILMDVTMPVLDGLEATRLLKASSATRDINVIAYTAQPSFYQKAFASLFVAILAKPIDPPAMVEMVRKYASVASQHALPETCSGSSGRRGRSDEKLRDNDEELRHHRAPWRTRCSDTWRRDAARRVPVAARAPRLRRHRPGHAGARDRGADGGVLGRERGDAAAAAVSRRRALVQLPHRGAQGRTPRSCSKRCRRSVALAVGGRSAALESMALYNDRALTLSAGDGPERLTGIAATPNLFEVLGVAPARGHDLRRGTARHARDRAERSRRGGGSSRADPAVVGSLGHARRRAVRSPG